MSHTVDHQWQALARQALVAAMLKDWTKAGDAIQAMINTPGLGSHTVGRSMLAWTDTAIRCCGWTPDSSPTWHYTGDAYTRTADDVAPDLRVAGWLITARLQNDQQRWNDIMHALPDGRHVTEVIIALLNVCATSISQTIHP